ncbi:MAG: AAA family ATPase [Ruminobacter sp.]|uniref:DnaA ATPase domain-containing protein n=1 Tax=Ruminobacter sp. TaxID=2774296 RepID=UPI001B4986C6|nr:DnaA/Hda family protein [Ruminobacter sp.]MBP3749137.1 AAA family ATPase [Ruminobacter sp.]
MSYDSEYKQIPLRMGYGEYEGTLESFYVTDSNRVSYNYLKEALSGDLKSSQHFIYLYGPKNGGKTHLLTASIKAAQDRGFSTIAMDLSDYMDSAPVSILQGAEDCDVICLDNIDAVAGIHDWEAEIFNLYNRWHENKKGIFIVAATASPIMAKFRKNDLITRLGSGVTLSIHPVSIAELPKLLILRESNRGTDLSRELADIVVSRLGNVGECIEAVDLIDSLAASLKKPVITKTFVEQIVKSVKQKSTGDYLKMM